MTHTFDAIICGGGLAGSAAALSLARSGHDVLVLDKARFPRKKLCGGLLTWKSVRLLESHFGETTSSLTDAGAINHASGRYAIRTFKSTLAEGGLTFPFHFVDRLVFDDLLLKRAAEAGATIEQEAQVTRCDPVAGVVTCADGRTFTAHYVIGADGANSKIRASFPNVNQERMQNLMAPTIEVRIPKEYFPEPVDFPRLYVGFLDAGYGWVFPNRDHVVVGICGLRQKKVNFSQVFKEYLDFLKVEDRTHFEVHGHPLPYGNYLDEPTFGRTLLAGDAGGFVEPLFGEGIFFALSTGMYAGDAVSIGLKTGSNPCPIYSRRLHTYIMPEIKASDRLRWTLFKSMQWFGPTGLGLFINSLSGPLGEMVHGIRSYAWLKSKRWDF